MKLILQAINALLRKIQNDHTWEKLPDKPFCEETKEITVEYNLDEVFLENFPVFAVGDTVTVKVDGVEYSLVAFDDDEYITIGDSRNDLENDAGQQGWQFYIPPESQEASFYSREPHTVSYSVPSIKTIDSKYLPNDISVSWNDLKDNPFYVEYGEPETIIENTNVSVYWSSGLGVTKGAFPMEIIRNDVYIVTFDGTEWKTIATNEAYGVGIGNKDLSVTNHGITEVEDGVCPFYIRQGSLFTANGNSGNHVVSVVHVESIYHTIDEAMFPEGSLIGRFGTGPSSEIFGDYINNVSSGLYSHTEGSHTTASGLYSHAEGYNTTASGDYSHAEGYNTTASGDYSHAEGQKTTASKGYSHAEGSNTTASGYYSHAEGYNTTASGQSAHAEGQNTTASGQFAHAEGASTLASSSYQHVEGKNNIEDKNNIYAHIVGNGTSGTNRSNAHTLDWDGNAWYAGTVEGTAMIVASSTEGSTKRFKITVDDSGTLTATEITE